MFDNLKKYFHARATSELPKYGLLYFDQLRGEYRVIDTTKIDSSIKERLSQILDRRDNGLLTWDDILAFDLTILEFQDFETLKAKICSLRSRYKSLVDTAEFENYSTLKKVDFTKPETEYDEKFLRTEYFYLIREFCSRYHSLSETEQLRSYLLKTGAVLTLFFFLLAAIIGGLYITNNKVVIDFANAFSTLSIVVFAGATGAFVSMQQRIQGITNQKGDPTWNLSLLTHGWLSIFLSPLSGAIFAVILFLFFAGGLLKGSIFPDITTPKQQILNMTAKIEPTNTNLEQSATNESNNQTTPNSPTPSPQSELKVTQNNLTPLMYFLSNTKPITGTDFARLLIWCFIAGFAERFVPDTLMRLVSQKKTGETAQT